MPGWLLLHPSDPAEAQLLPGEDSGAGSSASARSGSRNSVYALPSSDQALEDFQLGAARDRRRGGGRLAGRGAPRRRLSDEATQGRCFRAARDADCQEDRREARELARVLPRRGQLSDERRVELEALLTRLQKKAAEIAAVDFFDSRGRETAGGLLAEIAERLAPPPPAKPGKEPAPVEKPSGRTWVTRTGIHVDRMASAWLIRRFIDPDARFRFVAIRSTAPTRELRFDMFDGEYTHQGELCTFEVLLARFEIADAALRPIAEIVHDIDLKDEKYGRRETAASKRWSTDRHGPSRG